VQNVNPIQRVAGAVLFFVFLIFYPGYVPPTEGTMGDLKNLKPAPEPEPLSPALIYPNANDFANYFERLNQHGRFNGTILLSHHGEILVEEAFGFASRNPMTPLETRTSTFQLASVSKPLTSIVILGLYEQGRLDLDADLRTYIPQFPYEGISTRMLLSHRSGLHDYTYFSELYWEGEEPLHNSDVLQMLIDHTPNINFLPDRRYHYSNINYALLGSLVEVITGQTFPDYVEQALFQPLGIQQSYVIRDHNNQPEYATTGHTGISRPMAPWWMDAVSGAKSICATVYDLHVIDKALDNGVLLSRETFEKAVSGWGQMRARDSDYGLGWRLLDYDNDVQVVYHTGWWRGFRTLYLKIPEHNATAIILANTTNARLSIRDMTQRVLHAIESHPES